MARPGTLDEDSRLMVAILVDGLAEIADLPARPLIAAAFDAGRVGGETRFRGREISFIDREDVASLYQKAAKPTSRPPVMFLENYRRNYQEHLDEPPRPAPLPDPKPILIGRKLGRNDPCWCGSGKKYKKCHLAQDEKEKVRL